ncbi:MAG: hypothetical protein OEX04_03230 [Acidimicrobiia bacterium]|nr:hypothetical protein [Acidimicrobiia bacterium]MDH4306468.1 hypothetical protein [Acidimicrobiia bacterium]MDH5292948.1 hypothetical protein [Acidimicrobiia bacterium]
MSPTTVVTLVAVLAAVFLAVTAAMLWQEAKRRSFDEGVVYVVDDAVDFIHARLESIDLRRSDVKRIIEYEVFYLQGLAQERRANPVDVVAGGAEAAVEYIAARIAETHGVSYPLDGIREVLGHEAAYLRSIGAVGDPVKDDGVGGVEP